VNIWVVTIFGLVYLGMILGEIPGLALDRTGVALLGALALMALEQVTPAGAWQAVDVPTIALLFGLMVMSAQFRLGGFYSAITRRVVASEVTPSALLALVITVSGALSALLANDIVCLAVAPLLVEGCARKGLDPKPFLLALACAANVGSAATLIGNPQNMLIGQKLGLSFVAYLADAFVPAMLGLAVVWWVVRRAFATSWYRETQVPAVAVPAFDRWQTQKGLVVLTLLLVGFLVGGIPREVLALSAAAVLLTSRRMASRDVLGQVDWPLLVLFIGLFVVNFALADSGMLRAAERGLQAIGVELAHPVVLFPVTVLLSNLVSNVPAVMLLLPQATHPQAGAILALASTLAGNLFIVGSIANIIVVEQASALGVRVSWREHARIGVPVTLLTLAIAAAWLLLRVHA
jgi:Na+/H+ antiporter NhaD/arsenite permease-like protein